MSVTPALGDPTPSSGLCEYTHIRDIHHKQTHIHIKIKQSSLKKQKDEFFLFII